MTTLLTKQLVDEQVLAKAINEGYEVYVRKSDWSENPLIARNLTFVSNLYGRPAHDSNFSQAMSDDAADLDNEVARYAKAYELNKDDLLAFPVFCSEGKNIAYTTKQSATSKFCGFIYMSKESVRVAHSVKRISPSLKKSRREFVELVLKQLTAWSYGDVHEISIERDEEVLRHEKNIYSLEFISSMVERMVNGLYCHAQSYQNSQMLA